MGRRRVSGGGGREIRFDIKSFGVEINDGSEEITQPIREQADVMHARVRWGHFGEAGSFDALEIVDPVQSEKPMQVNEPEAKTPRQRRGFAKVVEKPRATPLGLRPAEKLGRVEERLAMTPRIGRARAAAIRRKPNA